VHIAIARSLSAVAWEMKKYKSFGMTDLLSHICWLPLGIEEYEPFDPMAIGLLGSSPVMAEARGVTEAVQKFRLCGGRRRVARVSAKLIRRELFGVSLWHGIPPLL